MNVWRWLGLFLFLAAVLCFVGTRLPVTAGEKGDKDKQAKEKDKDKDKKPKPPGNTSSAAKEILEKYMRRPRT